MHFAYAGSRAEEHCNADTVNSHHRRTKGSRSAEIQYLEIAYHFELKFAISLLCPRFFLPILASGSLMGEGGDNGAKDSDCMSMYRRRISN
jgi:hypothetical protein